MRHHLLRIASVLALVVVDRTAQAACDGDFGSGTANACTANTPICDPALKFCVLCNGDHGVAAATRPCPTIAPYCNLSDAPVGPAGSCAKCTASSQCGGASHGGPTCDVASGACTDPDTDGDGLLDSIEIALGSDPTKADTDGDGINDKIEMTPVGGGTPGQIDSDGDGIMDALDTDSDNDGLLDSAEGNVDTDGDGIADFRDPDDDNDTIATKDEIADATKANVSDDVDGDGKKNWLDNDADGDGVTDGVEGRADDDNDGIPNYLDAVDNRPKPEAGPEPDASSSGSSGTSGGPESSSGLPTGSHPEAQPEADRDDGGFASSADGVVEGTGLLCTGSPSSAGAPAVAFVLGTFALALVSRRRRKK